jgi:hypothetical protein
MELPETCRVSCQNKFVKLVHLVGFIIKKSPVYLLMLQLVILTLQESGNTTEMQNVRVKFVEY